MWLKPTGYLFSMWDWDYVFPAFKLLVTIIELNFDTLGNHLQTLSHTRYRLPLVVPSNDTPNVLAKGRRSNAQVVVEYWKHETE